MRRREPEGGYISCDTPPLGSVGGQPPRRKDGQLSGCSPPGSKHFNLTAVSTGGAGGWFSLGGASSSLGGSLQEEPALELELLAQSGAEHEQGPSKDKL